jgi:opacity protein-like surface antigen
VSPDAVLDDDPSDNTYDEDTWAVAAQVGAGVRFDLSDMFLVDIGYRFRGAFAADLNDNDGSDPLIGADFISHNILAGITVDF